jgi:hypothetical protein
MGTVGSVIIYMYEVKKYENKSPYDIFEPREKDIKEIYRKPNLLSVNKCDMKSTLLSAVSNGRNTLLNLCG